MSTTRWYRWIVRGGEVLLAVALLLVVLDLHGAIIRTAASLAGMRSGSPLFLAVDGGCQEGETWFPPLLRDLEEAGRRPRTPGGGAADVCNPRPRVLTTAPAGRDTLLFVNGIWVESRRSESAVASFTPVLRDGVNRLAVRDASGLGAFPTITWFDEVLWPDAGRSFRFLGERWQRPPRAAAVRLHRPLPERTTGSGPWQWVAGGALWTLELAVPLGVAPTSEPARVDAGGADGFKLGQAPLPPDAAPTPDPHRLPTRRLSLVRDAEGSVEVTAEACLPSDHLFVDWARDDALGGPEFVARTFQAEIYGWLSLADPQWRQRRPVEVAAERGDRDCVMLATHYTVPRASLYFSQFRHGSFLWSPGDELVVAGFGTLLQIDGRGADAVDGDRRTWRGGAGTMHRGSLVLRGYFDQRAPAASAAPREPARASVFAAWRSLPTLLPNLVTAALWGLAAVAPIALMLVALERHLGDAPDPDRIRRARAGLWALVAFGSAFALRDPIFGITRWLMQQFDLYEIVFDPVTERSAGSQLHVSLAIVVVLLTVPLLQCLSDVRTRRWPWLRRLPAALLAIALIACASSVLLALNIAGAVTFDVGPTLGELLAEIAEMLVPPLKPVLREADLTALVLGLLGAWVAIGFLLLWAPTYWLLAAAAPHGRFGGAAITAGWLIFLVPLLEPGAEAVSVIAGFVQGLPGYPGRGWLARHPELLEAVAWIGPALALIVIVALVLRCLREIAAAMLDDAIAQRLRRWMGLRVLLALGVVVVVPVVDQLGTMPGGADSLVFRLMRVFQSYGLVLALLAPFAAMQAFDARPGRAGPFELPRSLANVAAAAFAGYLTLWIAEPMTVLLLMVIGWLLFSERVLDADAVRGLTRAAPGDGERLVAALGELRLLETRKSALEKSFGEGKLRAVALGIQRAQLVAMRQQALTSLAGLPAELRRRLLAFGPGDTPLRNAMLGAKAGLAAAALFQILLRVDLRSVEAPGGASWLGLLRAVMVDPDYGLAGTEGVGSQVIILVTALVNAAAVWVIAGFLFGYVFHLIWGKDGFMKALVFGAGVAVPYLLSQAILAAGGTVPLDQFMRLVPLLLFLFVLGTLVFDGGSLRRANVGITQLPEIYGLKASVGYLSFAGALATAQPVLQFIQWVLR
ncbi:MAG: hypothetical protein JNK67_07070 [Alphaproteobacteria bacterium]|nr:hypothetical protein [Alphaproteobacteria bacterium]